MWAENSAPFLPILWWSLLPLIYAFGIHSPIFCELYQRISDEIWLVVLDIQRGGGVAGSIPAGAVAALT